MKLPVPSLFSKKSPSNYYLALLLRDDKAAAVILKEGGGKLEIVGQNETAFSTPLEEIDLDELLDTLDKTISKAENSLPPNIETEKTVFGVKESWVEEKKIKKDYLSKLKKICDSLSLEPIGFMVISEAISHLLTEEEGAPLSAILAELGKTEVTLSLFRAGKILETYSSPIEESLPKTVDRLLHHFSIDVLPSRLILFNGGSVDKEAQEFIAHHWSKSIPFLHVPQVSVLPEGFDNKAMVYGAAEQMGFSVLRELGDIKVVTLEGDEEKSSSVPEGGKHPTKKESKDLDEKANGEKSEDNKATKAENDEAEITRDGDNFGFVMGKDISSVPSTSKSGPILTKNTEEATASFSHHTPHTPRIDNFTHVRQEENAEEKTGDSKFSAILGSVMSVIGSLNPLKKTAGMSFNKWLVIIPLIIIIILGAGAFYLYSLKATVTLHMQTKDLDESTEITLRTDSSNDLSQKILAAKEVETSLDGSASTDATGKKDVGDKAKGTITLYNNSDGKRTVPAGTVLTSSNNLDFTTDKEAIIASASGDIFSGTKPGTTQVGVTAKAIGTESNLPSNTKFTVTGVSGVAGKNDSAFSGGTKKTVTVVAKKDIDTLTTNLPKDLQDKARDALKEKADSTQTIIPGFTSVTISKKSIDKDVGEEAKKVTIKGTVVFTTIEYDTSDLNEIAKGALNGKYDQDLAISDKGIQAELTDIKPGKNNDASATLVMKAGLLPKLEKDTLVESLVGKSFTDAEDYLKTIPQVTSADIVLSPRIPFLPSLLPRFARNITIVLETNE
ncbi:MAG: baseplate J/gp47 family protein [Patescibacteria group bacterium]